MSEQQPPYNLDPSDVFLKAFEMAAPVLLFMAMIFVPLICFIKWSNKKLDEANKKKSESELKTAIEIEAFKRSNGSADFLFYPRELLTAAEFLFFQTLKNVCKDFFYIAPKMGLWALVDSRENMTAWNKISRKHLDFTLCHPETMKPLLVIELDDSSHRDPKQRLRDLEKDAILKEVGVPVLRIPVARKYDEGAIRNLISGKIKRN